MAPHLENLRSWASLIWRIIKPLPPFQPGARASAHHRCQHKWQRHSRQRLCGLSPSDYTARSGTLTFAPGELSKTTAISIINDSVTEPDESFQFALSGASTGATLPARAAIGTIENDDFVAVPSIGWLAMLILISLMVVLVRARD